MENEDIHNSYIKITNLKTYKVSDMSFIEPSWTFGKVNSQLDQRQWIWEKNECFNLVFKEMLNSFSKRGHYKFVGGWFP